MSGVWLALGSAGALALFGRRGSPNKEIFDPRRAMLIFDIHWEEDDAEEALEDEERDPPSTLEDWLKLEAQALRAFGELIDRSGHASIVERGHWGTGVQIGLDSLKQALRTYTTLDAASMGRSGDDLEVDLAPYMTAGGFRIFPLGYNGPRYALDEWAPRLRRTLGGYRLVDE